MFCQGREGTVTGRDGVGNLLYHVQPVPHSLLQPLEVPGDSRIPGALSSYNVLGPCHRYLLLIDYFLYRCWFSLILAVFAFDFLHFPKSVGIYSFAFYLSILLSYFLLPPLPESLFLMNHRICNPLPSFSCGFGRE